MAESGPKLLLVCTVGKSPDPIVTSLLHWKPLRVWFVCSTATRRQVTDTIIRRVTDAGRPLDPGRCHFVDLSDEENLTSCVQEMNEKLTNEVRSWTEQGETHEVIVDVTGGTKCMSAALALCAAGWKCRFSYVGGERTPGGTVISGKERVTVADNPYDVLGLDAIDDFVAHFDQHAYGAAKTVAAAAKRRVPDPTKKAEFATLERLAEAFDAWERFDHKQAAHGLEALEKEKNDLRAALGDQAKGVIATLGALRSTARELDAAKGPVPSLTLVKDLLANAGRRREEGRFDDAVARLYRAIEAMAQVVLCQRHNISSTSRVRVEVLPDELAFCWSHRARDGAVKLGLQDAYCLLKALDDPLAKRFVDLELDDPDRSPLSARNNSILAHGFESISPEKAEELWEKALALASEIGVSKGDLTVFPRLSGEGNGTDENPGKNGRTGGVGQGQGGRATGSSRSS
jgi:CRISPR-associated protein (TIGR02710 family)